MSATELKGRKESTTKRGKPIPHLPRKRERRKGDRKCRLSPIEQGMGEKEERVLKKGGVYMGRTRRLTGKKRRLKGKEN